MAKITNTGDYTIMNSENIKGSDTGGAYFEFLIDSSDKLTAVPTDGVILGCRPRPGSIVLCLDTLSIYLLSNARQWQKVWETEDS